MIISSHTQNLSTDYVFDGTSPPYSTSSPTNPTNKYGLSKLGKPQFVIPSLYPAPPSPPRPISDFHFLP